MEKFIKLVIKKFTPQLRKEKQRSVIRILQSSPSVKKSKIEKEKLRPRLRRSIMSVSRNNDIIMISPSHGHSPTQTFEKLQNLNIDEKSGQVTTMDGSRKVNLGIKARKIILPPLSEGKNSRSITGKIKSLLSFNKKVNFYGLSFRKRTSSTLS